jgi:signal transduction histidine kinase
MEQGRLKPQEEPFILKDLAQKALGNLQTVTNRTITVDFRTEEYVYGNKERIEQVFTNLVTNAIKFSPKKSPIVVKSELKDGFITVGVKDFGIGIPVKDKKHIFDKFYHADEHKMYPGLGLGLYISSEIIKECGGKMWAQSTLGKGSAFFFSLPIYKGK